MLEIFKNDAFRVIPLTDTINQVKFVPGLIGRMGLFSTSPIASTSIAIEMQGADLIIVPPTPRGAPGTTVAKKGRSMLSISVPHFEINDAIMAEEVQGVRAYGTESQLETVQGYVASRMAQHRQSLEATHEYARIGAVKGVVTYAGGTELDLFSTFGVTPNTEIDLDLDAATPADGILRRKCADIIRKMAGALDGLPFTGVSCFCGDKFFDDLIAHKEVRATYLQQQEASQLRTSYVGNGASGSFGSFNFGGIVWENYRGKVGAVDYIHEDKAHFYPTGVPDLFKTAFAPADYVDTVNTMGKEVYAKTYLMDNEKGVHLDVQTNPLHYCKRPSVLFKAKR